MNSTFKWMIFFTLKFYFTKCSKVTPNVTYIHNFVVQEDDFFINHRNVEFISDSLSPSRIVGGELVDISEYPFVASLVTKNLTANKIEFSGGATIISSYWVVTAAHCIEFVNKFSIKTAAVRSNTNYWQKYYIEHPVTKTIIHDKYNKENSDYDIGLVKVVKPFSQKSEKPIAFARQHYQYIVGSPAIVLGWGSTKSTDHNVSDVLRYTEVSVVEHKRCANLYKKALKESNYVVTVNMMCAFGFGRDACHYDSGGPLIQNKTLIGIVSWATNVCAHSFLPGVYVNVSQFSSWILRYINQ